MLRAFSRLAVAAALICAIGGHWALLQSIAWTGMVISYSHEAGWKQALKKTFDGKHPCQLCKAVAEGKKTENRGVSLKTETKLDFFCWERSLSPNTDLSFQLPIFLTAPLQPRFETPPLPPPRFS
jgi:hypothetical protein